MFDARFKTDLDASFNDCIKTGFDVRVDPRIDACFGNRFDARIYTALDGGFDELILELMHVFVIVLVLGFILLWTLESMLGCSERSVASHY